VIATGARVKKPGEGMEGEDVELVARHDPTVDAAPPYQRLLGDALRGDASLFVSDESVEAAWRVVEPVLGDPTPPIEYEPGTWGPPEARKVFVGEEGWHDPGPEESAPC
jgi:glucose-6-phosphate 1-dehydrogenase